MFLQSSRTLKSKLVFLDVNLWGRSNTCTFTHEGQRIKLLLNQPKTGQAEKNSVAPKRKRDSTWSTLIRSKKRLLMNHQLSFLLLERLWKILISHFLLRYSLSLPNYLMSTSQISFHLPNIQHTIDLTPRATLSNLPHYQMNPIEHAKLKKQVGELLRRGS